MVLKLTWLGHASFKIEGKSTIYIDPWKISEKGKADIILITHSHYDHLSPTDISKIQTSKTIILTPSDGAKKLRGDVRKVKPGQTISIREVKVETVPAYNLNKPYHPKENNWVGYIIETEGTRIYHSGDTDFIPEMEKIKVDIALLPIGGTYTMTAEEAVEAAKSINPQLAIPIHYGDIVGTESDAKLFEKISKVKVRVLKKGETFEWGKTLSSNWSELS